MNKAIRLTIAAIALSTAAVTAQAAQPQPQRATITGCGQITLQDEGDVITALCYIDTQGRKLTRSMLEAVFTRYTPEALVQAQVGEGGNSAEVAVTIGHLNRYYTVKKNPD